jgi:methanethiol S-methyltransferase
VNWVRFSFPEDLERVTAPRRKTMGRILAFVYGVVAYVIFLATFLYAIGFVGNLFVPKSMDSGATGSFPVAVAIDALLLAVFAIQHSVMARPAFKQWSRRLMPQPVERSTYVLLASLALLLLFWQWQPLGGVIWQVDDEAARVALSMIFWAGWLTVLATTFLIDHFDLFGLRQVYLYVRGRDYRPTPFRTPGPYNVVRHPLYLGFLLAFWATPTMSATHFVFALATTVYILIAIQLEEHDLVVHHGDAYREYRERVPMVLPVPTSAWRPAFRLRSRRRSARATADAP